MQPIISYFKHSASFGDSLVKKFGQWLPDSIYIRLRYRFQMGMRLNLKNPQTFQEKLQWLKLHDRNPLYTTLVDKLLVKDYIAEKLGSQYVIPILGVWDKPRDIEWEKLPKRFVLKTNHSGGNTGVIICRDKTNFDRRKAIEKLNASLQQNIYKNLREWPYKNIERKVFAEKYIEPNPHSKDLPDYKFFCFNGEPKYCQVISGRGTKMCVDFFDYEWNHQPFHEPRNFPFAEIELKKPLCFEQMWEFSRTLAQGKAFCRVDFYETGNKVFFGEITFYPTSGMGGFQPEKYDIELGSMIDIKNSFNYR